MKVFVIGDPDAVLGFSLVGVPGQAVTNAEEAGRALDEALADPECGIVMVTENTSAMIEGRMDGLRMRSTIPLVIEIPGPGGARADRPALQELVFRAIGVKI
jgi:V/A-type H+-transporting ATPase subunit F